MKRTVIIVVGGLILLLLFALVSSAVRSAHLSKPLVTAQELQTAITNYYAEYGHYPVPEGTGKSDVYYSSHDAKHWGPLIVALCGGLDPAIGKAPTDDPALLTVPNPRHIVFLTFKKRDLDTSTGVGILKLPFPDKNGHVQYFNLAMDGNEDGVLGDKDEATGKLPDFEKGKPGGAVVNQGIALWIDFDERDSDDAPRWPCTY